MNEGWEKEGEGRGGEWEGEERGHTKLAPSESSTTKHIAHSRVNIFSNALSGLFNTCFGHQIVFQSCTHNWKACAKSQSVRRIKLKTILVELMPVAAAKKK